MGTDDNILSGDDIARMTSPRAIPSVVKRAAVRLNASSSAGLSAYETWLGGQAGGLLAFLGGSGGAADTMANVITGALAEITTYAALNRFVLWTFFPCTETAGESGLDVLAGLHDSYINTIFTALAAAVPTGDIWVRVGHEHNFYSAYPWGAAYLTPQQYVALDQYVKDRARAISNRFKWAHCPNWNVTGDGNVDIDPRPWFPGTGYVDAIMPDCYMQYGNVVTGTGRTVPQAIDYMFTAPFGVNFYTKWGAELALPIGFSEWGIDDDRLSGFINRVYEWADENPVMFFAYWDKNSPSFSCRISDGSKVQAEAAYRPAFKGSPVAWTPTLEFGQNLYGWLDFTDAATITNTGGEVASITNKGAGSPGAAANGSAGARPTVGTRNGKGSAVFDGGNDTLSQTVMSSFMPNMNEEETIVLQGFLNAGSSGFQYITAEADSGATVSRHAIGVHGGILRTQTSASVSGSNVNGVDFPVSTQPVVDTDLRGDDASVIVAIGPAQDTAYNQTVQVSVNGSWFTTNNRRRCSVTTTPTRIVYGADATNSGGVGNYCPWTAQHFMRINYRISQKVADRLSGWLASQMGLTSLLRASHPYKSVAPTYGLPAVS